MTDDDSNKPRVSDVFGLSEFLAKKREERCEELWDLSSDDNEESE